MKSSLLSLMCVSAVAGCVLDVASAQADTELRDHRETVGSPAVIIAPRYRRRPGPRFMMPLKIDIGAAGVSTTHGFAPGISAAVGIHWASLSPTPTDFDIGVGVFGALLAAPKDPNMMGAATGVAYGGTYVEVAHTLAKGTWWRTWAGGRGEYLKSSAFDETRSGFGVAGRLSAELYVSGTGIAPQGVFLGTYAIGVYVEAGVRDVVSDVGAMNISGGLTFRTPLVFAP